MARPKGRSNITQADRDKVMAEFETGAGCREIARRLKMDPRSVSKIVREAGGTFDSTPSMKKAQEIYAERRKTLRAKAAELALEAAVEAYEAALSPHTRVEVITAGQNAGTFVEYEMDRPDAQSRRNYLDAGYKGIAASKVVEELDGQTNVDNAKSTLAKMSEGFEEMAKALRAADESSPNEDGDPTGNPADEEATQDTEEP